jgi:DNA-binding PadR family transcriptional regulator
MNDDVFRSTGTKSKEIEPLRRPRPSIHKEFRDGITLGYAFDEDGIPEDKPTCLPENKLNNHWGMFGSSGSGKTIKTTNMALSAHENTSGPTILVDPKQGNMIENYCRAHYKQFGDLRDVYVFSVPETLPAIPFFDIRPYLHEGMNRNDAIQQKADQFHMIMHMIVDNYDAAYVARTVLDALVKALFDKKHGSASYTLDELYDAALKLSSERSPPRVSHQSQVARIFDSNLEKSEQEFKNTMQAVLNRLDDLQEDINLFRLFNQNPKWDEESGTYEFNRTTDEQAAESDNGTANQTQDTADHDGDDDPFAGLSGKPDPTIQLNDKEGGDTPNNIPAQIGGSNTPQSALDFRLFLDEDCVILFDTGNFVRDKSQEAFSMYILTSLWGDVRSRYKTQDSAQALDKTTKIIIEEAAPIVATDLVTNTLIPEAREFGLSLGMIMQYPKQVEHTGVDAAFDELKNNVQTKIYGQIEAEHSIANSLIHDEKGSAEIKNKIRRLPGGEWIADLPSPRFGVEVPPPFSLRSLDVPDGHPEGDNPLSGTEEQQFQNRFNARKNRTLSKHGIERPDTDELIKEHGIGSTGSLEDDGFTLDDEGVSNGRKEEISSEKIGDMNRNSGTELRDRNKNSGQKPNVPSSNQVEKNTLDTSDISNTSDVPDTSDTEDNKQSNAESHGGGDFDGVEPLPAGELQKHCEGEYPKYNGPDAIAETAMYLSDQIDGQIFKRALVKLAQIAQNNEMDVTASDLYRSTQSQSDPETTPEKETINKIANPDGNNRPNAHDIEDSSRGQNSTDESDTDQPQSETAPTATDTDTTTDSDQTRDEAQESSQDRFEGDYNASPTSPEKTESEANEGAAEASQSNPSAEDEKDSNDTEGEHEDLITEGELDGYFEREESQNKDSEEPTDSDRTDSDTDSQHSADNSETDSPENASEGEESQTRHPSNVDLDTPLKAAHGGLSADERDDHDLSEDDAQFLCLIADAFRDELDDYDLTQSMKTLEDRAGSPNIDTLIDNGYIDSTKVIRKKYYSLTRKGWRVINDGVPGNKFGDHMEKIQHRVGVYLFKQYILNDEEEYQDIENVKSYEVHRGETYDLVGYGSESDIKCVAEVETNSNNVKALVDDYKKLSEVPGKSSWVFPSNTVLKELWSKLEDEVLENSYPDRSKKRVQLLQEKLDGRKEEGADNVYIYSQIK